MKNIMITCLLLCCTWLYAERVGKVSFLIGKAFYKTNNSAKWQSLQLETAIDQNGYVQTQVDAELEILWNNGTRYRVKGESNTAVKDLFEKSKKSMNWQEKMEDKLAFLVATREKTKATNVAGIRKDEVSLDKSSELFWAVDPVYYLKDGIEQYDNQHYAEAITTFKKVIEQGPLRSDAEIAHAYLAICYNKLNGTADAREHLELLLKDFPGSGLVEFVNEALAGGK